MHRKEIKVVGEVKIPALQKELERETLPLIRPLIGYRLSDAGNAERLASVCGNISRYCPSYGKWFIWDGRRWAIDEKGQIKKFAVETIRQTGRQAVYIRDNSREKVVKWALQSESAMKINAMLSLAQSLLPVSSKEFDKDPWLLNVLNGTLDLRTGELGPHRREDLITKLAPVEYYPEAQAPTWDRFLNRIFDRNQRVISFMERAVGYSLTGKVGEHALFFLHGDGANGKSTFVNVLLHLLGDYGKMAAPNLLIHKFFDDHPTGVADLNGCRLAICSEVEEGRRLAEALVKQLTGGDTVKARFMRQDFFEYEPAYKIFLVGNHKPNIGGTDWGIWRRIRLIPFNVTIPEEERDRQLGEKLKAEGPGILRWALEGCLDWQRGGLRPPEEVQMATAEYREEMDSIGSFIEECCIKDPSQGNLANPLYQAYREYCSQSGMEPMSQKDFGLAMRERGFQKGKTNLGILYKGIRAVGP